MNVLVLSGSGLSADSGLPTFRGAGGLYEGMRVEQFLSAEGYARDAEAVEQWLDGLRAAEMAATPNRAHQRLAEYQAAHAGVGLFTQNVDMLLERAGAQHVIHLHGRIDCLRCLGHGHRVQLGEGFRAGAPERCPRCSSRLRSDVVLFGEMAPEYATLHSALRRATRDDALVIIGTEGSVLPVNDIALAFPGRRILNNLHASEWIDAELFDRVFEAPAAEAVDEVLETLEGWRGE